MRDTDPNFGHRTSADDDRAVSELLGFVLTFGIILMSVGLLTVVGFGSVTEYQEHQQLRNAESAMDSLAQNFEDVAKYDGIQTRSGELNPRGGSLSIEEGGKLTIDGDNYDPIGRFAYEYEGSVVAYEGGGVFYDDGDGSVTVRDPMIQCDGDGIATFVEIENTDHERIQSSSPQAITMTQSGDTEVYDSGPYTLGTHFDSSIDAWDEPVSGCDVDLVRVVPVEIHYNE